MSLPDTVNDPVIIILPEKLLEPVVAKDPVWSLPITTPEPEITIEPVIPRDPVIVIEPVTPTAGSVSTGGGLGLLIKSAESVWKGYGTTNPDIIKSGRPQSGKI